MLMPVLDVHDSLLYREAVHCWVVRVAVSEPQVVRVWELSASLLGQTGGSADLYRVSLNARTLRTNVLLGVVPKHVVLNARRRMFHVLLNVGSDLTPILC